MGDFVGHNVKGANQVVLKEIMEFAEYLGMDPVEDGDLLWIAEQARNAPLPAPWSEHQDEAGNTYYYNSATDDSVWEHPLDQYYRDRESAPANFYQYTASKFSLANCH